MLHAGVSVITLRKEPISEQQEIDLTKMFLSPGFAVLISILESRKDEIIAANIQEALESDDYDGKIATLKANIRDAHKIQACLSILEEVRKQPDQHQLVKLSQTSKKS